MAREEPPQREGREPVHVLLRRDRGDDPLLVHLAGERELDEDPVDGRIITQAPDLPDHLFRGCVSGQFERDRPDPDPLARLVLHPDVEPRARDPFRR